MCVLKIIARLHLGGDERADRQSERDVYLVPDKRSALMVAAERVGIQVPRARCIGSRQKSHDLAREAVSWNAVLGGGPF